jgi:NADPH:quinone reductase-like Zn-dependent oxidoreductase
VKEVTGGEGADVVYDPVGGDVFDGSTKCIAFEGRILTIGFAGGRIPTLAINRVLLKNFSVVGVHWGFYQRRGSPLVQEWMDALLKLYADGRIRPVIYRAYPLREAAAALGALASRESYGKVVLVP